jgi:hypothetical protein
MRGDQIEFALDSKTVEWANHLSERSMRTLATSFKIRPPPKLQLLWSAFEDMGIDHHVFQPPLSQQIQGHSDIEAAFNGQEEREKCQRQWKEGNGTQPGAKWAPGVVGSKPPFLCTKNS